MAARLNLDLAGIKLKLSEWAKLDRVTRARLAEMPCGHPDEAQAYRAFLDARVSAACGSPPARCEPPIPLWQAPEVPAQVEEKARALGAEVTAAAWRLWSPLQRFALMKLSRPGHEGGNFLPALREFSPKPGR